MTTDTTRARPCPFCGGINIVHCGHHMYCHACGAEGPDADSQHETEAIAAWNRRAPTAQPAVDALAEAEYFIDNPSAWSNFDQCASDAIAAVCKAFRTSRAPADSVTAPVGGETYHLGACIVEDMLHATVMRKEPGRAGAVTVLLSEQIPVEHLQDRDVIVNATPPAQAADSVLEDAARYRWLRATTNYVTSNGERIDVRNTPEKWDAAIDAARAAQEDKSHGRDA